MIRSRFLLALLIAGLSLSVSTPALAQSGSTSSLTISTNYPSLIIGVGETVSMSMQVRSASAGTVTLSTANLPKGWTAPNSAGEEN